MIKYFIVLVFFLNAFTSKVIAFDKKPINDDDIFGYNNFSVPIPNYYNPNEEDPFAKLKAFFNGITNFTDNLIKASPNAKLELPVGIRKKENNIEYTVGIYQLKFSPTYTEFSAFARVIIPQKDDKGEKMELFFVGEGLRISAKGGIYASDASLKLIANAKIDLGGGKSYLILKGGKNRTDATYINIDCNGFKELQLNADVLFPRNVLQPVDEKFKVIDDSKKYVTGSFKTKVRSWNDILVDNISFTPFTVTGAQGFSFQIDRAALDLSDVENITDLTFPDGYPNGAALVNDKTWRGIFINKVQLNLPPQFDREGNSQTANFSVSQLIIDQSGVTGNFESTNLLNIDDGKAGGWPIGVSKLDIKFIANNITYGSIEGKIKVPIDDNSQLKYNGTISKEQGFQLVVQPVDKLKFDVWNAVNVNLDPNSKIELKINGDVFEPKATLNGAMNIVTNDNTGSSTSTKDEDKTKVDGLLFKDLVLQTKAPFFSVKEMGYQGEIKMGFIPASLNNINVTTDDQIAKLKFGITVGLTGAKDGNFGGSTDIEIAGKYDSTNSHWAYDYTRINGVGVDMDFGAFAIKGRVLRYEGDAQYGSGFLGALGFKVKALSNLSVDAKVLFGNTGKYPYWYVDAMVSGLSIPIAPAVFINTFGGGAYGNMKLNGMASDPNSIGASTSGMNYVPDTSSSLGLRAVVGMNAATEDAFNAKASLEISFNNNAGINFIKLNGEANMLAPIATDIQDKMKGLLSTLGHDFATRQNETKTAFTPNAAISAILNMQLDFQTSTFSGLLQAYINAGVIKGVGERGLAGQVSVLFGPDNWHIKIGEPANPIGIELLGIAKVQSYLMMGTNLPGSPAPPAAIWNAMGVDQKTALTNAGYMTSLNTRTSSTGFAFGTNMQVQTGDLNFLFFYGKFNAGVGFDIMLKKYNNTTCKDMPANSKIGIDGWYANGQAYAYLDGEIGVNVDLLFIKGRYPILAIGAGAILQAQLPNPNWFHGRVGGHFSLLGGLLQGQCDFKVSIGQQCEAIDTKVLPMDAIADIKPSDKEGAVDVFAVPEIAFNYKINEAFSLSDNGVSKRYRVKLNKFDLLKNGTTPVVLKKTVWNNTNDKLSLFTNEILDPKTNFTLDAKVTFEEEASPNTWKVVYVNGKLVEEIKQFTFTTGDAPTTIPEQNIIFTYPVSAQKNYFKNEYNQGYVQLDKGQNYLFNDTRFTKQLQIQDANKNVVSSVGFTYDAALKRLNWQMPSLSNQTSYRLVLVNKAAVSGGSSAIATTNTQVTDATSNTSYTTQTKKIGGDLSNKDASAVELLAYNFRTSKYNTLAEKINDIRFDNADSYINIDPETPPIGAIVTPVTELFDKIELIGSNFTKMLESDTILPLVKAEAVLDNTNGYYMQDIYPMQYKDFTFGGSIDLNTLNNVTTTGRGNQNLPLIPTFAVYYHTQYLQTINNPIAGTYYTFPYVFFATKQFKNDYNPIKTAVANKSLQLQYPLLFATGSTQINYPVVKNTLYKMKLTYQLPGNVGVGTSAIFTIDYKSGQALHAGGGW
jgi:hypothetical protein